MTGKDRGAVTPRLRQVRPDAVRRQEEEAAALRRVELRIEIVEARLHRRVATDILFHPGLEQAERLHIGFDVRHGLEIADQVRRERHAVIVDRIAEQPRAVPTDQPVGIDGDLQIEIVEVARAARDAARDIAADIGGVDARQRNGPRRSFVRRAWIARRSLVLRKCRLRAQQQRRSEGPPPQIAPRHARTVRKQAIVRPPQRRRPHCFLRLTAPPWCAKSSRKPRPSATVAARSLRIPPACRAGGTGASPQTMTRRRCDLLLRQGCQHNTETLYACNRRLPLS